MPLISLPTEVAVPDASSLRREAEIVIARVHDMLALSGVAPAVPMSGAHRRKRAGSGEMFWQFKPYAAGDRPQDIDWKQSGRGDDVFIRQRERQTAQPICLWASAYPGMRFRSNRKLEEKGWRAAVLTTALALLHLGAGEPVCLAGTGMRPGRTEQTMEQLADILVTHLNQSASQPSLPDLRTVPRGSNLYLVGDFLDSPETIVRNVEPLAPRLSEVCMIHTLDPAELSLPYRGRCLFNRNETDGDGLLIADVQSVRDQYLDRLRRHTDALVALCHRHGWTFLPHATNEDASTLIGGLWARRQQEAQA